MRGKLLAKKGDLTMVLRGSSAFPLAGDSAINNMRRQKQMLVKSWLPSIEGKLIEDPPSLPGRWTGEHKNKQIQAMLTRNLVGDNKKFRLDIKS